MIHPHLSAGQIRGLTMTKINLPYPISANRYWRRSGHVMHVSTEAKRYKQNAHLLAIAAKMRLIDGDIFLSVRVSPKLTKKGTESKVLLDLDNCLKVLIDCLIGIAYTDDKQVRKIVAEYAEPIQGGGVEVEVRPL